MNRTSRSWLGRGAWRAVVVLLGLLLSAYKPARTRQSDPSAIGNRIATAAENLVTLPTDCLTVDTGGTITAFDNTKRGCALTEFAIPWTKEATTITAIGPNAFSDNKLTGLTIPNSVISIGDFAFYYNQLTNLTIGNSVKTIGSYAFYSNNLTSLSIGNNVKMIGSRAFYNNQLTSLTIPDSVERIGYEAFANNSNLKTIILDPNPNLFFFANAFLGNLWAPFNLQIPKKAGTWTWDDSMWDFTAN